MQEAMKEARHKAGINNPASGNMSRYFFASHLSENEEAIQPA
jgi:hypothetical protein